MLLYPIHRTSRPQRESNVRAAPDAAFHAVGYLTRWELGLAALYAEAEDPSWATALTEEEARLAARYAPIQLGGLPLWMESLVDAHPGAVDAVLGNELSWELSRRPGSDGHFILLQDINYASEPVVRLFLPRLRDWLNGNGDIVHGASELAGATERLRQVIGTMVKHGDEDTRACARDVARPRLCEDLPKELALVWLPTLMRVDPDIGVSVLEKRLGRVEPGKLSEAVSCFAVVFSDRHDEIDLKTPAFTWSYRHWQAAAVGGRLILP